MMRSPKIVATGGFLLYILITIALYTSDVCTQDAVRVPVVSILESVLQLVNAIRLMLQIIGLRGSTDSHLSGQTDILILVCVVSVSIQSISNNVHVYAL